MGGEVWSSGSTGQYPWMVSIFRYTSRMAMLASLEPAIPQNFAGEVRSRYHWQFERPTRYKNLSYCFLFFGGAGGLGCSIEVPPTGCAPLRMSASNDATSLACNLAAPPTGISTTEVPSRCRNSSSEGPACRCLHQRSIQARMTFGSMLC